MNKQDKKPSGRKNGFSSFLKRRQVRYGGLATLLTAVVIAVVILLNVALGAIENRWALKIDLSATQVTAFSQATYDTLRDLQKDVEIYTVYQPGSQSQLRVQVEEVLSKYRTLSPHIVLGNIDPVSNPELVKKYAKDQPVSEGTIIVTDPAATRVKIIPPTDYYTTQTSQYTGQAYTVFSAEMYVTSAILNTTSETTPKVYFLSGHEEISSANCSILVKQLGLDNYDVTDLKLSAGDVTLAKGDTVIVISPKTDLLDDEYAAMRDWLTAGGRLMMVYETNTDATKLANFTKLLDYYNLSFGDGYVQEDNANTSAYTQEPYFLVPTMNAEHDVAKRLAAKYGDSTFLFIPYARPINAVAFPESGIQYANLLTSSAKARPITEAGPGDAGTQILAMTALDQDYEDATNDVRIALLGSPYLVADTNLVSKAYNIQFAEKLVDWLSNRDTTVSVAYKYAQDEALAIPDQASMILLAVIVIGGIPLIVMGLGIFVWFRRRRL